jgi:glycosyltransferase involved in cell wall biosynthesis
MKFGLPSFNKDSIKKGLNYLKSTGMDGVMSQVRYKMSGPGLAYNNWYKEKHEVDAEEISRQRETHFEFEPLISIIVPVYMTPEFFLRSMIESVMRQSYENWQLCLVDGSQADKVIPDRKPSADRVILQAENDAAEAAGQEISTEAGAESENEPTGVYENLYSLETERIIHSYMDKDPRIRCFLMEEDTGIADCTNVGIDMSAGTYLAFLEHDDVLTDDALFCVVEALQEKNYDLLYSDEDKMSEDGDKYSDPEFKPDFSIDLIRSRNYIHRFLVVSKRLALSIGGLNSEFDGGQGYDFILRCIENTENIKHISRVLYHYRVHTQGFRNAKREHSYEVEKRALAEHLKRCGEYATLGVSDLQGVYKVHYETPGNPYISIIIPGGQRQDVLDRLLTPLFQLARYSNFEIIIIDQDGTDQVMLNYYHRMERLRRNISVVVNREADSLTTLRNFGAARARGEYLLFLDCNLEIINPSAIGDMLAVCMRKDVGITSGVLYNDNNTVYHQGYVVGVNGNYDHLYRGLRRNTLGYMMQNRMNLDLSAVSASCMMVKKELFDELGGFFESFSTELAAVDFCLRVREKDMLVVCVADADWYYHDGYVYEPIRKNRVHPEEDEKNAETLTEDRFHTPSEDELFDASWYEFIAKGDPYYNVNFARDGELFSLE